MDFSLSEEQRMMVDAARRLVEKHFQPILDANDKDRALPKTEILKVMAKAAELGLTAARIPEASGGAGLRMLDYGLITEQIPPNVTLIVQPHEATTARVYFGCSEEQKERYLADLMGGRKIACTASTEPDVGSDPRGIRTTVTEDGDHLVLKGRKQWISNSTVCDLMNVTCRKLNADGTSSLARVLVDPVESPFEAREVRMHELRQAPLGERKSRCHPPGKSPTCYRPGTPILGRRPPLADYWNCRTAPIGSGYAQAEQNPPARPKLPR